MDADTPETVSAPQNRAERWGDGSERQENSLVCAGCGHKLARAVICHEEKCSEPFDKTHYHCLNKECGEMCGMTGTCLPREPDNHRVPRGPLRPLANIGKGWGKSDGANRQA